MGYRGTPAEHKADAVLRAKGYRRLAKVAAQQAKRGQCHAAVIALAYAGVARGAYISNREWSRPVHAKRTAKVGGDFGKLVRQVQRACAIRRVR